MSRRVELKIEVKKDLFGFLSFNLTPQDLRETALKSCRENGFTYISHRTEGNFLFVIASVPFDHANDIEF